MVINVFWVYIFTQAWESAQPDSLKHQLQNRDRKLASFVGSGPDYHQNCLFLVWVIFNVVIFR